MKYLIGVISVLVVVVLVGSVMVPIINDSATGGVEYEDNPDWDGWVRFDLNRSAAATYHLGMWQDEDGIYVDNITSDSLDRQIYDDSATVEYETIMYADSNTVIWSFDDTFNAQGKVNGQPVFLNGTIFDVIRSADGVTVTTESDSVTFDAPSWAYVPLSTGAYGFYPYDEGRGVEHPANAPTAVLGGGFAGVYAYNNAYTFNGLGLAMTPIVEDGLYYGATWAKGEPEIPDDITITPLDPSIIGGGDVGTNPIIPIDDPFDPSLEPTSVPTPTYTDGDWGYDLTTVSGVQKAIIVSYSGAGGGVITVPSTIGGYEVYQLNKDAWSNVFDTSITATGLVISEGIKIIEASAVKGCTGFTGSLVIPSSVTTIGNAAFYGCTGFTGSLVIPSSVTTIGNTAFQGCTGFTGSLVIPSSVTTIGNTAFAECSGFTGSLVIPSGVTSIQSYTFRGCTGFTGSLVIPSGVTSIGAYAFSGNSNLTSCVIVSDATPSSGAYNNLNSVSQILDLSDVQDYSTNRYGLPAAAEVSDSIGDCFGFVSIVTTAHGSPGGLGQFSPLMYAIPLVVIGSLLVAFAAYIIRRDY